MICQAELRLKVDIHTCALEADHFGPHRCPTCDVTWVPWSAEVRDYR